MSVTPIKQVGFPTVQQFQKAIAAFRIFREDYSTFEKYLINNIPIEVDFY